MHDDLILRLEAATEGSRELDAEIGLASSAWVFDGRGSVGVREDNGGIRWVARAPGPVDHQQAVGIIAGCLSLLRYTTSLDAALTLVPAGWGQAQFFARADGRWIARLKRIADSELVAIDNDPAPTAPLAFCIAALKAIAAG